MQKRWKIKTNIKVSSFKVSERAEEIIKILMENRGLKTKKQTKEFFEPPQPWSNETTKQLNIDKKEIKKAVMRVKQAIKNKENIIVYGDYDADGVCGTAILWETLHDLGAKAMPFIPHREEHGYGLSIKGIEEILNNESMKQLSNETILIITVDNGIVAHKAVEYAKSKGIDVIITDHHQKRLNAKSKKLKANFDLPKAEAIVWSDKVCGAGVAWILSQALSVKGSAHNREKLDLAAIGTIGDLMPLLGPNRSIVKFGLKHLNKTKRIGLVQLIKESGLEKGKIQAWHVGYILAPRLNAMGRMVSALDSLRLLCTKDSKRAGDLAVLLGQTNKERQELTLATFEKAKESQRSKVKGQRLIFAVSKDYNQGIIGLVAGRLVEEYYRPAIVISQGSVYSKASVRSVKGFNIIEYLRAFESYFEDIGGHPMAAGFTVRTDKLEELEKQLLSDSQEKISDKLLQPATSADCEIGLSDISQKLYDELSKFAPFGMGNPQPIFVSRGVEVASFRQVGMDGKHLKLSVKDSVKGSTLDNIDAIAFGLGALAEKLSPGQKVDILYNIEENIWNGNKSLQLKIKDIKI